jgi:hypothetical protein
MQTKVAKWKKKYTLLIYSLTLFHSLGKREDIPLALPLPAKAQSTG